jgi:isoamylase
LIEIEWVGTQKKNTKKQNALLTHTQTTPLNTPKHQSAVNFAVTSSGATGITLCLFTRADLAAGRTTHEVDLDPALNRTGAVWHALLPSIPDLDGLLYGYRARGPHQDDVAEDLAGWESVGGEEGGPGDPASNPAAGHRFDGGAVMVDPYARAVVGPRRAYGVLGPALPYDSPGTLGVARTWPQAAGALPHPAVDDYDWEGDAPLRLAPEDLVIYEMHVRGFTAHPSSGLPDARRGTYAGLVDKLDYLAGLGVNAIELLPVHEFNELEYVSLPEEAGNGWTGETPPPGARFNYWGYSTLNFFSPMARYATDPSHGPAIINEFRDMVKACHARGIEVILDVVFNHSAEGNERGPALSFRGLDNRTYYMLAPGGQYYNYSGCGNTLNCNHPAVVDLIVGALRYWVTEMHVDGFRFDLASILTRAHSAWAPSGVVVGGGDGGEEHHHHRTLPHAGDDGACCASTTSASGALLTPGGGMSDGAGVPTGTPLPDPPLIAAIAADPVLRHTKLIAEAWDCDGLNQVGAFPHYGGRFAEWNGHFRDTVRQFVKGTDGPWAPAFAAALCGSPSIYAAPAGEGDWWGSGPGARWRGGRGPTASINFVTAHDGFTLADLVSYNEKHNDANGEGGADGEAHNLSWNCGVEGPTTDGGVARLRARQVRNLLASLLLAHGVPMLHMGDEYGHTKGGNNNTYCHDGPLNWFDWGAAAADAGGSLRFTRALLRLRRAHPELRRAAYVQDGEVEWHGTAVGEPDWSDGSRLVALSLRGRDGGGLYVAWSAAHTPTVVGLPDWPGREWRPVLDSGKPAPYDALVVDEALSAADVAGAVAAAAGWTREGVYPLLPWACVVLESVPAGEGAERFHGLDDLAVATGGAGAAVGAAAAAAAAPSTPTTADPSHAPPGRAMTPAERAAFAAAAAENERLRAQLAALDEAETKGDGAA